MRHLKHLSLQVLTLCVVLALTACGGGGSTEASTPATTPTTNSISTATASECPIGDYKGDVVALVNSYRASARVCGATAFAAAGGLSWNGALASAAEVHSNDMAVNNYFGHPDANGVRIGGRASNAGYSYGSVGENIAAGQTSASQVVADWMASPSHCENIMKASFYDIGVSCKYNPSATYQYYWTLTMGNH
ncbi:MAG TPA: CAP domain-containing protein [Burkholderiaceae bacterium]|nr:CAP domain-containing protein [Burkholderiaceae bacterium]